MFYKKNDDFVLDTLLNQLCSMEIVFRLDSFFNDNSQLDFNEVVNTNQKAKQKYSYHYMNKEKELIFRYDNVQHHREIKTFPHHKHTENGIFESSEPNLENVLAEIEKIILND